MSPWFNEYVDLNGIPNNGGSVTVYLTGTTTPAAVFADYTGNVANTNPVQLNSQGYPVNPIWLDITHIYDAIVKDSAGNIVYQLNHITTPPATPSTVAALGVWVDAVVAPTISSGTQFTLAGKWDVTLSAGRRLKVTLNSGTTEIFGAVKNTVYTVGTNTTLVTMICDGTGSIYASGGVDKAYYSCLDSVNLATPYVSYCGANVGSFDAIVTYLPTAVMPLAHNTRITVRNSWSGTGSFPTNQTTTPTLNVNDTGIRSIFADFGQPVLLNSMPEYADFVFDANINGWILSNPAFTTEQQKFEMMPIGVPFPFFPSIIGTDVVTWLIAHPKFRMLLNSHVSGIAGSVIGVSKPDAYAPNSVYGTNAGSVPAHTHTGTVSAHNHTGSSIGAHDHPVTDPGHTHIIPKTVVESASNAFAGVSSVGAWAGSSVTERSVTEITIGASSSAALNIASDAPLLVINSAGETTSDQNMQQTYVCDWVYKYI